MIYKVNRVNEPHVPLSAYKNMSAYKLFMIDVGLLGALSELDAQSILEGNDIFVEFKGALTEQYVLQQLSAKYKPDMAIRLSTKNYMEQEWLINVPLYAVCNI